MEAVDVLGYDALKMAVLLESREELVCEGGTDGVEKGEKCSVKAIEERGIPREFREIENALGVGNRGCPRSSTCPLR